MDCSLVVLELMHMVTKSSHREVCHHVKFLKNASRLVQKLLESYIKMRKKKKTMVRKGKNSIFFYEGGIEKSFPWDYHFSSLSKPCDVFCSIQN